jgi:predicted dehydrogenase
MNIALLGTKFMGRAHSNAWRNVGSFFDVPVEARRHTVCGRDPAGTEAFARRWGWARWSTRWQDVVASDEIDLVDVGTPNDVHRAQAIAAIEAGKHVACEKPLAGTLDDARAMRDAARTARRRGVRTFVWFNYRRCPAVALAHRLVRDGRLGRIFHVRALYLQDWGGPDTPLIWRFDGAVAGSGAHGDLNAHIVDMARFITGDEFAEICGAVEETFIETRAIVGALATGGIAGPAKGPRGRGVAGAKKARRGRSTVDDCVAFIARMTGGAVATFEATRLATGNQNRNAIEVNGERGAIRFDFERMNELQWWDHTLDPALRGWSRIMCTSGGAHPYAGAYWPPAHLIGYEHGFTSQAADILAVLGGRDPVVPLPDFADACETQRVLEAAIIAARERRAVAMAEIPA